jgi:ectoine hydroxylase-related dioxygenase (phytanoyl-CoA dioxygenase family)
MPRGSCCVFLGSLVHGGGANRSDASRLGVIMEYAAAWLRPQENLCLSISRDVARGLPRRLSELIGYDLYPPFLGYVNGEHPSALLEVGSTR